MEIIPMETRLGAEVRGIDAGGELSTDEQLALRAALDKHLALLVRGQNLVPVDKHIRFAQAFGPLGAIADTLIGMGKREYQPGEIPECVSVISNIKVSGKDIGSLGDGECFWHNDSCFAETPPAACVLHSIELPSDGGNTAFLDMIDALETLPADLRQRIEGRKIRHSLVYTSAGDERPQYAGSTDVTNQPGPEHPIIRTLDDSGKQCLFLGRRLGSYIVGMPLAESEELLDVLWAHTISDNRVWSHKWALGDVVIWDNRTTMHHRDPFDPNQQRRMHKVQVAGGRPT